MAIDRRVILDYIEENRNFLITNEQLFDVLEGELLSKIDKELREQLLSNKAYEAARRRIPTINIIKRIIDKLSKIYSTPVSRDAENPVDQEIMDFYINEMQVDTYFGDSNRFFNSMRNTLVEPFLDGDLPRMRVIPSHQFLPFSDDPIDPNRMTHLIKFMGEIDGSEAFFVYTADEFLAFNEQGKTLNQFMKENEGINPFGIIFQTYINKSRHLLVPKADKDLLQMGILIPLILTDLNFAVEFMSHSIIFGIDLDSDNLELNPNAFWDLKSDSEGNKPEIGQIKPQVDIPQVVELVEFLLVRWMESRNIRPMGAGRVGADNASSGISLMIKEVDTTDDRKEQIRFYQEAEKVFWQNIKVMHNTWVEAGLIKEKRKFSDEFDPVIVFPKPVPLETLDDIIARHEKLFDLGLTTKRLALRDIFPDRKEEEIEEMLKEIEEAEGFIDGLAEIQPENIEEV